MQTTEQILPTMRRAVPQIYMYDDTSFPGWIKIGQTTRADVRKRIDEQHPITEPHKTYHLLWHDNAFYADGSGESFSDHDLHEMLHRMGKELIGEWCRCSLREAKAAYVAVRHRDTQVETVRDLDYSMRPEQEQAVEQTTAYFAKMDAEEPNRPSHYLWNAKMRFGKTFATYQLAKRMKAKRILVLTFKPAVEDSWRDDLMRHRDFEGWRYYSSRSEERFPSLSSSKPLVVFGSFQDYLGRDRYGNIKPKNEWVHSIDWDLIVLDEYHFGAWNDNAKSLLDLGDADAKRRQAEEDEVMSESGIDVEGGRAWDDEDVPITGKHYLYLSGTPFRALATGEFMENQIFNWTYQDEQAAKIENSKLKIENGGKSSYNP
ncbi:MAG: restriction endonuclease, partial [Bacteroidaceae bacterium]|nr:restriction endonuclease [Bacteroidaceae bacterium]